MRKLMAFVAALGAGPIVAIALQTAAPAFADTPGQAPACVSQTLNPHPTDPAGQTTNSLFCASATPNGTGSGGSGSGKTGAGTGTGTTGGGSQTTLASTSTTSGSTPDESGRALNGTWSSSGSGQPAASNDTGLFGGLVGFFASAGGLAFLFGLLMLMLIVLIALAVVAAIRRGGKSFASRFSRVSYRA
jgi:hypothetical protein